MLKVLATRVNSNFANQCTFSSETCLRGAEPQSHYFLLLSSRARMADEVQVTGPRREINKWRNTDWNVQIPGERRQLAPAGGQVGVSRRCCAHDDSAPGGTAFQTSGKKAETSVHARQPPRTSKGPVATGAGGDLW